MNKKSLYVSLIVVAVIAIIGAYQFPSVKEQVRDVVDLGANAGPDFYTQVTFHDGATQGGYLFATTSQGTVTYTNRTLFRDGSLANVIEHTTTAAVTATLPASTTLAAYIPQAGQSKTVYLKNVGTTRLTLVGGSGTLLKVASTTQTFFLTPGRTAILNFFRKSNTDIEVIMVPGI